MSRITLYTAVYGGYDIIKSTNEVQGANRILYTDNPMIVAPGWEVRVMPLDELDTPMLRAKWWKCRPDLAVGGEISIWIDGSMIPREGFVHRCEVALGVADVAFTPHPWRDCIYTEQLASTGLPKYQGADLVAQVEYYRSIGHPEHWGLFASGAMIRRHTPAVLEMGRHWWHENLTRSWQDQLSLPVVLRLAGDDIIWNTGLPWSGLWDYAEHAR